MICKYTVIQDWAISQIRRTWSRDLVTPLQVVLIGSVNHILGLGFLIIGVKLIWPQMQFHGIFLWAFMDWRIVTWSWGAWYIPCFSWGIGWLAWFRGLTSAYWKYDFSSSSPGVPVAHRQGFFFLIDERLFFCYSLNFQLFLAAAWPLLRFFFIRTSAFLFCGIRRFFTCLLNPI